MSFDRCAVFRVQSCVSVFKSLSVLEKTVDKCKISMQTDEERLIFQLYCHHGSFVFCLVCIYHECTANEGVC